MQRLQQAVRFVWQAGPGLSLSSLALVAGQGLMPVLGLYLLKLIVDTTAGMATQGAAYTGGWQLGGYIALAGGVAVLAAWLRQAGEYVQETQAEVVADCVFDLIHERSARLDLAYYENPAYFDTLHRAQAEGPYRPTRIVDSLVRIVQNGVGLTAMAGLLLIFHWSLPVILVAAALPAMLVRMRYSDRLFGWQRQQTHAERHARYYNWMLTGEAHAKEIRLFDLGGLFAQRFHTLRRQLRTEHLALRRGRLTADAGAQGLASAALFGLLAWVCFQCAGGLVSIGAMVMYFQAFQKGSGCIAQLLSGLAELYDNHLFLDQFYGFLALEPTLRSPDPPAKVPTPMTVGVTFDQVGFRYPAGGQAVLADVSFSIAPGEVVALVGANGAGKTTLVKLLCRLYDPDQGRITCDGQDIKAFDPEQWRRQCSVIFQDFIQYQVSAGDNIWFGDVSGHGEQAKIEQAAALAGIHQMIQQLPAGYDTVLGKLFDQGRELSIGQWQKVALARAFFRDAQLVVLDEPTAAMDAASEFEVFRQFRRLLAGRSALIISHRFSTVRLADRILVFEGGRIVESGSHDQLMQRNGLYAGLFVQQAGPYLN